MSLSLLFLWCIAYTRLQAQDSSSLYNKIYNFPDKLFGSINSKSQGLQNKLTQQTEKYLSRLARQEKKLQKKLWKKDSAAAKELFGDVEARYAALKGKLTEPVQSNKFRNVYSSHLDSMKTAFNFLQQNNLLQQTPELQGKLNGVMQSYGQLQGKLNQTDQINKFLKERQQQLKSQIDKFGLTKQYRKFQKEVYYYRAQVDQYKKTLEDPKKLEAKLLQLASKIPAFKNFFAKHSELGSLFRLPGSSDPLNGATASIAGLQTRAMVQQELQQRLGTNMNVNQVVQQNIGAAQSQINQLKNKLSQLGGNASDADMPDFRPNSQRTRGFLKRIELGTNFQSTKSNSFFPVTTDIGLSAGYKISDRSVVGIGGSYKLGWGRDIQHIRFSHQGIGIRSYLDWKLKGSFWISGGMELNYRNEINDFTILKDYSAWQKSGLVGLSKVISIKSKFFKKTKAQLLWDFLSYQQVPRTPAIMFRMGYSLK